MVIKVKYNGEWVKIPYLSSDHGRELVEEAPKDNKQYARQDGTWTVVNIPEVDFTEVYEAIDTKVYKVTGKGLSTNDYITEDKTKVTNVNEVIEAAASAITATGISITLDKRNLVTNAVENIELNLPASTTALAGLMLPSDKTKLNGIAAGAEVNVNADWNATEGDALILNKPTIPTVDVNKEYVDTQLATKSDLPDYTVFDIVANIINQESLGISQEDYNTLLSKLVENQLMYTFPVRENGFSIVSLAGVSNSTGDGYITLIIQQETGAGSITTLQLGIKSDLTLESSVGAIGFNATNDTGIDIFVTQGNTEDVKNKQITLHTTGDGTKSLMDDGKYRKLPVYGKNLLLGSGKEVSNSNYNIANYWLAEQIPEGTQVTVTIWGELGEGKESFNVYNSTGDSIPLCSVRSSDFINGKGSITFNWKILKENNYIKVYSYPNTSSSISTIHKIKLEYGDISTEWTPAWEDIPDLEERYAYGVEWDTTSSSPDGVRVGNMQLHRELPIQSGMRRCLIDNNGGVIKYIYNSNESQSSVLEEALMTEIPQHWYKLYTTGTKFRMMLSAIPLPGYKEVPKFYISTCEAIIERNTNTLGSARLVDSTNVNFRGGNNTAEWDGTYRSLLGCPVTGLSMDEFRQAARKRGSGWEMYTYEAHKTLFWLFAVEYATLNSQKPFNAQKDANGFSQGGLGDGAVNLPNPATFNQNNPVVPCGITNSFGNNSGVVDYTVYDAEGAVYCTLTPNRYRGIENPFGSNWKKIDGIVAHVTSLDPVTIKVYTTTDPTNFASNSLTGYDYIGSISNQTGWMKKALLQEYRDILPIELNGSSSTYWCAYYYVPTYSGTGYYYFRTGGGISTATSALAYFQPRWYSTEKQAYDDTTRLCFFPKYKSTEIITE